MRVRFTLAAFLLAVAAWGQDNPFDRAPKEVDDALRARINEFFHFHVTGEYRKAEALVAEDTKDYFYDHNKPKYVSAEIQQIIYSDNFTRAKAIVLCEQRINAPGFGNQLFKVPTPSTWKLEDGKWVWWVDPELRNLTPFGKMTPGPDTGKGGAPAAPVIPDNADFLFKQVVIDKSDVTVKPGESATVTISNSAPGAMTLSLQNAPVGIETKLSSSTLQSGEKATLTIRNPKSGMPGEVRITVDPIGQVFTVNVHNGTVERPAQSSTALMTNSQVMVNKAEVRALPGSSDMVEIINRSPSVLSLSVPKKPEKMEVTLTTSTLPPGAKGTLRIANQGEGAAGDLQLKVDPTGQVFTIKVLNK